VICLVTRYVSLASIIAALVMPLAAWVAAYSRLMIVIDAMLAVLAIYKHKANIGRLLKGTENRLGRKAGPPATGAAR
jgi:glycerol-3-phosphate acyltransferase PlsY